MKGASPSNHHSDTGIHDLPVEILDLILDAVPDVYSLCVGRVSKLWYAIHLPFPGMNIKLFTQELLHLNDYRLIAILFGVTEESISSLLPLMRPITREFLKHGPRSEVDMSYHNVQYMTKIYARGFISFESNNTRSMFTFAQFINPWSDTYFMDHVFLPACTQVGYLSILRRFDRCDKLLPRSAIKCNWRIDKAILSGRVDVIEFILSHDFVEGTDLAFDALDKIPHNRIKKVLALLFPRLKNYYFDPNLDRFIKKGSFKLLRALSLDVNQCRYALKYIFDILPKNINLKNFEWALMQVGDKNHATIVIRVLNTYRMDLMYMLCKVRGWSIMNWASKFVKLVVVVSERKKMEFSKINSSLSRYAVKICVSIGHLLRSKKFAKSPIRVLKDDLNAISEDLRIHYPSIMRYTGSMNDPD